MATYWATACQDTWEYRCGPKVETALITKDESTTIRNLPPLSVNVKQIHVNWKAMPYELFDDPIPNIIVPGVAQVKVQARGVLHSGQGGRQQTTISAGRKRAGLIRVEANACPKWSALSRSRKDPLVAIGRRVKTRLLVERLVPHYIPPFHAMRSAFFPH